MAQAKLQAAARWALGAALAIACLSCERRAPQTPASPSPASVLAAHASDASASEAPGEREPIAVPRGCDVNLSGRYRLARRASARYQVSDDGLHLTARALGADASEAGGMSLTLDRTAKGFIGQVLGTARTAGGRECPVAFSAALVACRAQEIVIQSADELKVDEQCRQRESPQSVTEKVLEREYE